MPWRLIGFIAIFGVFLAFITFNLENRCDISFGITTYKDVPIFLTVFSSFFLGALCTLPIVISAGKKRREKLMKERIQELDEASPRNRENNFSLREKFMRDHGGKSSGGGNNG